MISNNLIALQITAIGMGLVFAAILLLWLMMAVLMRFTGEKENKNKPSSIDENG
jgi:Na+-transporting methylmalonyl-CoA/oxaloacetate decarboxylase gamma subunit